MNKASQIYSVSLLIGTDFVLSFKPGLLLFDAGRRIAFFINPNSKKPAGRSYLTAHPPLPALHEILIRSVPKIKRKKPLCALKIMF